ncbi:uncharacterized protein F5147DRAFT_652124 [Suillus discolor]|uniref:Uncharacterized protein n=1 Tax=Suillus discolor TaxID=1912936 RepID=A0A9P7JUM6_9AGAM|nr:uncharacterized protein F5147DRAFT_652124 [Suillus discolor]KAG2109945.1 hypothetical protein F5147DRAFT_652124 [Suillus discolor]
MVISVYKCPVSPAIGDKTATSKNGNIIVKRPKLNEPMYPLPPPFRQTPSPVMVSQSYLQKLIMERWEAELKNCEHAKKLQLLEMVPGPALTLLQANLRRLIVERWEAEVRRCEEAKRAQLFELVLAAHGGETYLESYDLDVIRWIHHDRPEVRTRSVPPQKG